MAESFERHRQPWTSDEIQKLHTLAKKGMALKAIAKALTRSEESIKTRAKRDGSISPSCASDRSYPLRLSLSKPGGSTPFDCLPRQALGTGFDRLRVSASRDDRR